MNSRETALRLTGNILLCITFLIILAIPYQTHATIILSTNNWNKAKLEDWTKSDDWIKPAKTGSYLKEYIGSPASFSSNDALPDASSQSLFSGNWSAKDHNKQDFWASNTVPDAVQIMRGTINEEIPIEMRTELGSSFFSDYTDWEYDVDQATFVSGLASIDWIGEYIWSPKLNDPVYGIDSSSLVVPEPHTIILLLASGTTAALAFRKRKTHSPNNSIDHS